MNFHPKGDAARECVMINFCSSLAMDPVSRLNVVCLQDPLPTPLDLTEQISEALDLVKKKKKKKSSSRSRASGTDSTCSSHSEFGYESVCVPLNVSLPNGFTHVPVKTLVNATGNSAGRSRSRLPLPVVETLSSECSRSGHTEHVSSDDSDGIEVPVSSSDLLTGRDSDNKKWKKERMENSSPNLMEWAGLQDSDSLESRNVPSTSEAENADCFKPIQNGPVTSSSPSSSPSSLSPSQKRAPAAKKNGNRERARSSAGKKATTSAAKRRKKKKRSGLLPPSAFPSLEPEIKLKYASCKEAKRDSRGNTFAPYVRMEFSACTVVNFEEDGDLQVRKQRQPAASPGTVPTTSCLQLGRLGSEGRSQTGEMCCLCGRMANAAGLGDLHGPYHSCGPDRKMPEDLLINGHEDACVKRKRKSDEVGEQWVHEDCSIWSAGVFLVKGRLYGLDEVLRLAQKAVSPRSVALSIYFIYKRNVNVEEFHQVNRAVRM